MHYHLAVTMGQFRSSRLLGNNGDRQVQAVRSLKFGGSIVRGVGTYSEMTIPGRSLLPEGMAEHIGQIDQRAAYVHLLFKLKGLPRYGPPLEYLNADPHTRFNMGLFTDPELLQQSFEACQRGELTSHPPSALQIPTVMPSLPMRQFDLLSKIEN